MIEQAAHNSAARIPHKLAKMQDLRIDARPPFAALPLLSWAGWPALPKMPQHPVRVANSDRMLRDGNTEKPRRPGSLIGLAAALCSGSRRQDSAAIPGWQINA